ncbi:catalase [Pseudorhodoferax sp. Leaf267]|uniref:catalase n=1 Tax=Pseudorhodoferax sp. Leaf267 TaxID=1736316 RepID=UPI001F337293|nr:catalase [Pseudorhodoferax sp. Leaf267]
MLAPPWCQAFFAFARARCCGTVRRRGGLETREKLAPADLLDSTKLIPEELAPVRAIGRMQLNRTPEQRRHRDRPVAFHTSNLVPGIDVSADPLAQGRFRT